MAWETEEEICDNIWADHERLLGEFHISAEGKYYREKEIAYGLRPDFLYTGTNQNPCRPGCPDFTTPTIILYEVKITATVDSVSQLANYIWVTKKHANHWVNSDPIKIRHRFEHRPEIEGILIAKHIDGHLVHSTAEINGIRLVRYLKNPQGEVELNSEDHPYDIATPSGEFSNWLSNEWATPCH